MAVNKALLRETMDFIEKNPEKHDQARWCGTAQCFAGWACHLDGWRRTEDAVLVAYNGTPQKDIEEFEAAEATLVQQGGTIGEVEDVARSILGLTTEQARELFDWENDIDRLSGLVSELCK